MGHCPWGGGTRRLDYPVAPGAGRRVAGERISTEDATPQQEGSEIGSLPLHDFALIMLGIHLFDNTNLEAVAVVATERNRWEFLRWPDRCRFATARGRLSTRSRCSELRLTIGRGGLGDRQEVAPRFNIKELRFLNRRRPPSSNTTTGEATRILTWMRR